MHDEKEPSLETDAEETDAMESVFFAFLATNVIEEDEIAIILKYLELGTAFEDAVALRAWFEENYNFAEKKTLRELCLEAIITNADRIIELQDQLIESSRQEGPLGGPHANPHEQKGKRRAKQSRIPFTGRLMAWPQSAFALAWTTVVTVCGLCPPWIDKESFSHGYPPTLSPAG
jgi:hypothetical protein